jgi:hypothetical protein
LLTVTYSNPSEQSYPIQAKGKKIIILDDDLINGFKITKQEAIRLAIKSIDHKDLFIQTVEADIKNNLW